MNLSGSAGRNPLLSLSMHLPDAEARVMPDGRLYLYGSWDQSETSYCSTQYRVASTHDLNTWTLHGESFDSKQVPWTTVAAERQLYAPDAIERDGTYYLYFCLSDDSEGVASSKSPAGPFTNPIRMAASGIDPAIFVDDDGTAYYYWGQFAAKGARLNPDMISIDESSIVDDIVTVREHSFHEGSSLRKRNGIYYYVFADESRGKPTALGYATSTSPLGPFEYRGVIIDNDGIDPENWNNHGSIAEFNGQWYVFYHRSSRNTRFMRRVCAEPITFSEDGLIPEVVMTSQGPGNPFGVGEFIPAFTACGLSGSAYLAPFGDSEALTSIGDGDSATFRYLENTVPLANVTIHAEGTAAIEICIDGSSAGLVNAPRAKHPISVGPGTHEVKLVFHTPEHFTLIGTVFE